MNDPDELISPEDKDLRDSLFNTFLIGFVDERKAKKRAETLRFIMECLSVEQKTALRAMIGKRGEIQDQPADAVEESPGEISEEELEKILAPLTDEESAAVKPVYF